MKRRNTIHEAPGDTPSEAPRDAATLEFARRLQQKMIAHGWNQSELARRASAYMPEGKTIQRDTISLYINARNLPGPERLHALAKVFKVDPNELLSARGVTNAAKMPPSIDVREIGDGRVWVRVNQAMDWADALKVLEIVKGGKNEAAE